MAMLKNFYPLMILSIVVIALLPKASFAIGKEPDCSKGMTEDCGSQFFKIIVNANTTAPADECCRELVKAGKNCHNQFVHLIISTHKLDKGKISGVYKRSNETWNNCVATANSV